MAKLFLHLTLICLSGTLYSQSIVGSFNSTAAGRSVSLDYNIEKKETNIGLGIGVNINKYAPGYSINEIYYKKLNADQFHEYFAFKAYIHQTILQKSNYKIFAFYDFQLRRSGAKSQLFSGYGYDSSLVKTRPEEGILYHEVVIEYGPYLWLENTLGVGFKLKLSERFYIQQKFGAGITFIKGKGEGNHKFNHDSSDSFVGYLISFGIGYRLKN